MHTIPEMENEEIYDFITTSYSNKHAQVQGCLSTCPYDAMLDSVEQLRTSSKKGVLFSATHFAA